MALESYKPGRIFEWFAHLTALGWGLILALPGDTMSIHSGFSGLAMSGWSESALAFTATLIGIVGCMALWVNGKKPFGSPRFRAAAAGGGIFIYGQFFASLANDFAHTGVVSLGLVTYGLMALFCVYACFQSSRDAAPR